MHRGVRGSTGLGYIPKKHFFVALPNMIYIHNLKQLKGQIIGILEETEFFY